MVEYRIVIRDKNGVNIGEFTDWLNLRFSKTLNYYGRCSFNVPVNHAFIDTLSKLRSYETVIYRDNTIVWAGEQVYRGGSLRYGSPNLIEFISYDFMELPNAMFTEQAQTYEQIDAGAIAWDMIDVFQQKTGGDLGITEGVIETTQPRDRKYYSHNVLEEIIRLTKVIGGFDFEITNDKVFNVYSRMGNDKSATIVFEYGTNIRAVHRINQDFTNPVNQAIVLGELIDNYQERTEVTDATSRSTYGLRQGVVTTYNVSDTQTFIDKGNDLLKTRKQPVLSLEFTQMATTQPQFGSVGLGDIVRLKLTEGLYNIDGMFRVYGWNVKISQDGDEEIDYLISTQI